MAGGKGGKPIHAILRAQGHSHVGVLAGLGLAEWQIFPCYAVSWESPFKASIPFPMMMLHFLLLGDTIWVTLSEGLCQDSRCNLEREDFPSSWPLDSQRFQDRLLGLGP